MIKLQKKKKVYNKTLNSIHETFAAFDFTWSSVQLIVDVMKLNSVHISFKT